MCDPLTKLAYYLGQDNSYTLGDDRRKNILDKIAFLMQIDIYMQYDICWSQLSNEKMNKDQPSRYCTDL